MDDNERTLIDKVPSALRSEARLVDRDDDFKTPTLTMISDPNPGRRVSIDLRNRAVFLGRDETCEFTIDDPSVSRRHARIYREQRAGESPAIIVQDLGSTNGSYVNDHPTDRARLHSGDAIFLGDVELRFEMLDSVDLAYLDDLDRAVEESEKDPLTGLMHRGAMKTHLPRLVERCEENSWPVAAVLLDLDHFKKVNDTRGHAAGDQVLRVVGALVRDAVRREDLAIRYGGEEVLVVLAGTRRLHALLMADRMREAIASTRFPTMLDLFVTGSFGVAERQPNESIEDWLDRADRALYRAKSAGRNRAEAAPSS
ncbi:MAG: GGDEF domain-containing protein [Deltaproteobacteria bacterium]|nr:GGDEF domain-containing protein [Deltaproteobacteria bacterium]